MENKTWEKFYSESIAPSDIDEIESQISKFCNYHFSRNTCAVLVTSGGTTVPLEHNTVRFVDNFSAGTRGAASAEYFIKAGYAVIFLYRAKSLEPFTRHVSVSDLLESFHPCFNDDGKRVIEVQGVTCDQLLPIIDLYKDTMSKKLLLKIPFTTLACYLHILRVAACTIRFMKKDAMLYLAAAVSDFYVPHENMAEHKISSTDKLSLNLELVPKVLQPLVRFWIPEAYVISFKLETNASILIKKAKGALENYGHKLVIANELHNRKQKVILVTQEEEKVLLLSEEEMKMGKEIEEKIVQELVFRHNQFRHISE